LFHHFLELYFIFYGLSNFKNVQVYKEHKLRYLAGTRCWNTSSPWPGAGLKEENRSLLCEGEEEDGRGPHRRGVERSSGSGTRLALRSESTNGSDRELKDGRLGGSRRMMVTQLGVDGWR
jgi:hypothetical protein